MIFPSRSQLASKQITRTGRAEAGSRGSSIDAALRGDRSSWYPRGNRILAQPDRDVSAAPEATLVLPPVPDSVLRLVLTVDSARLPCGHDVAPLISMMDRNPPPMLACPLTPIHAPMPVVEVTCTGIWLDLTDHCAAASSSPGGKEENTGAASKLSDRLTMGSVEVTSIDPVKLVRPNNSAMP